jgi:hypothetical protein
MSVPDAETVTFVPDFKLTASLVPDKPLTTVPSTFQVL